MNENIKKALQNLENANYAGYFEEMDRLELPNALKAQFSTMKGRFISGQTSYDYAQQLTTFTRMVDSAISEQPTENLDTTKQELIELIDNVQIAEFFAKVKAMEGYDKSTFNRFEKEFILGRTDFNFYDRLRTFISTIKFTEKIDIRNKGNNDGNNNDNNSENNPTFIHEVKLIILGNGRVGKTTIAKNLQNPNYGIQDEPSTEGIGKFSFEWEISKNEVSKEFQEYKIWKQHDSLKFKFNVYDFGGQGIYRAVQHIFCSRRSCYLLVSSKDEEDNSPNDKYISLAYWLPFIDTFGYQLNKTEDKISPVLLVVNKSDLFKNPIENKRFESLKIEEAEKCGYNLQDSLPITCGNPQNIESLKTAIINMIPVVNSYIFDKNYDVSYLEVKRILEKENSNYITYTRYKEICIANNIVEEEEMQDWLQVLVNIGTVMHFKRPERKQDILILNPEWVKTAVYDVLKKNFIKNKGRFYRNEFEDIWENTNDHEYFISLLEAYELCYISQDDFENEFYVVPALLSLKEPQDLHNIFQNIPFTMRFEYSPIIPAGTLHKVIVRLHRKIYNDWKWQHGLILGSSIDNLVWVSEHWQEKYIELKFNGANNEIYNLVKMTLNFLNDDLLSQDVINLDFVEKILYKGDFVGLQVVENEKDFAWLFDKPSAKKQIIELIEANKFDEAFMLFLISTRGSELYNNFLIPTHTEYKEYKDDKLAGLNVHGRLAEISRNLMKILDKYE